MTCFETQPDPTNRATNQTTNRAQGARSLVVLRHGPTAWNRLRKIQGRRDEPLDVAGRADVATWRLPTAMYDWHWIASPLQRCIETATILSGQTPRLEPRFIEMDWGDWEGETIQEMSGNHPQTFADWEGGDQFISVPNGESPGAVRDRVGAALQSFTDDGPWVLVAHKGVIRALVALATGWDMTGKPPIKYRDACWHHFTLEADGALKIVQMNNSLIPEPCNA